MNNSKMINTSVEDSRENYKRYYRDNISCFSFPGIIQLIFNFNINFELTNSYIFSYFKINCQIYSD